MGREQRTLAALSSLMLLGVDAPELPFVRAPSDALPADVARWERQPFDAVATDADLDGDTDVLINWHHSEPLELLENRGGRFARVGTARSGLEENRGFPSLFASEEQMAAKLTADAPAGLTLWRDRSQGLWRFHWRPGSRTWLRAWREPPNLQVTIEATLRIELTEGLEPGEITRASPSEIRVALSAGGEPRDFSVRVAPREGGRLRVQVEPDAAGATPALRVGPELTPATKGQAELWLPDPHGIAWVDVEGDRRPELFLTRGALVGKLLPPAQGKQNLYYLPREGEAWYQRAPADRVPPDYGRGRRIEWVDVDNDGALEASVGNRARADLLLQRDPDTGRWVDRASELGLGRKATAVQTWFDWDRDGWQDLVILRRSELRALRNIGGSHFETTEALASVEHGVTKRLLAPTQLRLADFDADGDLDLWLIAAGDRGTAQVLLRDGLGWKKPSRDLGISGLSGIQAFVLLDFDNDGFEDAASFGREAWLWHNRGGEHFELISLPADLVPEPILAAAPLDANGDGLTDLFLAGRQRHLLLNRFVGGGDWVDLVPRQPGHEPIGAMVRVVHANGRANTRRWGSAHNSRAGQALQPLRFGVLREAPLVRIEVLWPGDTAPQVYPAPPLGERTELHRAPAP